MLASFESPTQFASYDDIAPTDVSSLDDISPSSQPTETAPTLVTSQTPQPSMPPSLASPTPRPTPKATTMAPVIPTASPTMIATATSDNAPPKPPPSEAYNIDMSFAPNVPPALQANFQRVARRLEQVVVGDLPNQTRIVVDDEDYQCEDVPTFVDDMFICAQVAPLPDFVDAMGGFYQVRFDGTYLPYIGYITLTDARDITDHPDAVLVRSQRMQ